MVLYLPMFNSVGLHKKINARAELSSEIGYAALAVTATSHSPN
jgi:hypothetical protein